MITGSSKLSYLGTYISLVIIDYRFSKLIVVSEELAVRICMRSISKSFSNSIPAKIPAYTFPNTVFSLEGRN